MAIDPYSATALAGLQLVGGYFAAHNAMETAELNQKIAEKNAEFAEQVIQSGRHSRKITEAYIKNTTKEQRNSQELSELLIAQDIDLSNLPDTDLASQAAELATQRKAQLAGATAAGQTTEEQ